ncbi:ExbD/TolR family protein [Nitratidesulfovibrio sp.]|uniref:ExbD/TolR family protein n=1 Tax=Nitratidesulfovibrio sp. TaxID=2802297 RepID=UPI00333F2927
MQAASDEDGGVVSEINVTPFVDVMLVLLVIFMITTPMMQSGLDVSLPQTETVDVLPEDSDHVVLTIRADGTLLLDEDTLGDGDIAAFMRERVVTPDRLLFLRADANVPYGRVVRVMGMVRAAGVHKMHVMAEEEDTPEARP